ncbi:DUF3606 domain-containing protein [Dyadobacter sp. BHUBP1]|uniref:DUF3606 domain-containing protein n=1 Tax=Dyadobacter sp. BHUBP1 TaxID=3424178 RepID=UPI003D339FA4
MADDKLKKDFRDRNKIAADEDYELDYVANEHGVSRQDVLGAIKAVGNDRSKVQLYLKRQSK